VSGGSLDSGTWERREVFQRWENWRRRRLENVGRLGCNKYRQLCGSLVEGVYGWVAR
jgi:hypothetical protein